MFTIPELAMPRTRKVTTIYNGKKEIWDDREEAQDFFLRQMMTAEGEAHTWVGGMQRRGRIINGRALLLCRAFCFSIKE